MTTTLTAYAEETYTETREARILIQHHRQRGRQCHGIVPVGDVGISTDIPAFPENAEPAEIPVRHLYRLVGNRRGGRHCEACLQLLHHGRGALGRVLQRHECLPEIVLSEISALERSNAENAFRHEAQRLLPFLRKPG